MHPLRLLALDTSTHLMSLGVRVACPHTTPTDRQWLHTGEGGAQASAHLVPAVLALQESDLIVSLGARFDDRVTGKLDAFAPGARVIHIDIDPAELNKIKAAHVGIRGDAKAVLERLYAEHPSSRQLGKRLGVSHTTIANKLRQHGVGKD